MKTKKNINRKYNVRPDSLDFRDKIFVPTLVEVPTQISINEYKTWKLPVLDQGNEGACTGYGLAAVANYLLRRRKVVPDNTLVSPQMLYEMARRYDEWQGEDYDGASARGAMKGWNKHGVCSVELWPFGKAKPNCTNNELSIDAGKRPLGAYYRVNHNDLVAMHSALAEVGILYASAIVHDGWNKVGKNGIIPHQVDKLGGHAFAIVAFDERGFWIQNSWGESWGMGGLALVTYDDWLTNGTDVWVSRLGAPYRLDINKDIVSTKSIFVREIHIGANNDLRPHIISIGNDGLLRNTGNYANSANDIAEIFQEDFPRITKDWTKKRILFYAHGGLTSEDSAIQRVSDYRFQLLKAEVYPISIIWKTDFWTTITNILKDSVSRRRPEGILDSSKDFMLDRLDDGIEPLARTLGGKALWDEMKENALSATTKPDGGVRLTLQYIKEILKADPTVEIHIAGHSAGSILHAPFVKLMTDNGIKITTCTLWAPACTIDLFKVNYLPSIKNGSIKLFSLFSMTDTAEQDDQCARIYHKSLLYLVSNAFEDKARIPIFRDGKPILGMEKFVKKDKDVNAIFNNKNCFWIKSPNNNSETLLHSTAKAHGDFDDDEPTLVATLSRIIQKDEAEVKFNFHRSASSLRERRRRL